MNIIDLLGVVPVKRQDEFICLSIPYQFTGNGMKWQNKKLQNFINPSDTQYLATEVLSISVEATEANII